MKTALSYIFIVFGMVLLWASTYRPAMQYISEHREGDKWWDTYPCMHGDLVSLCYLDFVPKFNSPHNWPSFPRATHDSLKNTLLVLYGDSFTWHLADSNFADVSVLNYVNRSNKGHYHIDKSKRNMLLIEVSERYLRSYFESKEMFNDLVDSATRISEVSNPAPGRTKYAGVFDVGFFFNKYINQNLQCNIFNYNFIMPMFECKAAVNYYLFNRASGDVVISDDRNFLFLRETVSKTDNSGSYAPVTADEIQDIVANLNAIYDHYKKSGFEEVYFSIIPNAATIMQPQGYNNLIPLVQNDPALKMKVIDIYSVFKKSHDIYYLPGDTHWNTKGKQLWLDMVNKQLLQ